MKISIEKLKELIEEIENEYNVEPNENNQSDCLNAKEGYEILMKKVINSFSNDFYCL